VARRKETKPRAPYARWSLEAEHILLALYREHATMAEMVEILNRPAPNIRAKLSRMRLKLSDRLNAPNRAAFDRLLASRGLPPRYNTPENA